MMRCIRLLFKNKVTIKLYHQQQKLNSFYLKIYIELCWKIPQILRIKIEDRNGYVITKESYNVLG